MWFDAHAELAAIRARAQARIDSLPTEAPAPDEVTVTPRKKLVVDIHAPKTATIHAADYWVGIDADGNLKVSCQNIAMRVSFDMSPAAARAIGAELIRMGGE
jgi:hypothetical protein